MAQSLAVGALGGAVGEGLTAGFSTVQALVAANAVTGASVGVIDSSLGGKSTTTGASTNGANGAVDGFYSAWDDSDNASPAVWDWAFGMLS